MWTYHKSCSSKARLDNKVAVITGANTGIGKETARDFYRRGAKVILVCRNIEKAKNAVEDIKNIPFSRTGDRFELQLQSNYLGHFLLTLLLLPKMQSGANDCRIVNVSSVGHACTQIGKIHFNDMNLERSYGPLKAYVQSKRANILFTRELARRLKEAEISGINVYSLHPGFIRTDIDRHFNRTIILGFFEYIMRPFIKNPVQGAQTTIHCAVDEKVTGETGLYYAECRVTRPHWKARDDQMAKDLWDHTCQLLHLESDENLSTFLQVVSPQLAE